MASQNLNTHLTPSALQRRIKKYLPRTNFTLFIPCPLSLASLQKEELLQKNIGTDLKVDADGVELKGDWKTLYECNLHCSMGTRVLMRMDEFYANSYPELFQKLKRIHWEVFVGFHEVFDVHVTAKESRLHHTENIRQTVVQAIQEKMQTMHRTVSVQQNAPICVYIRFYQDRCMVSLDTSGGALYKRGYKQHQGDAPLRENLAAGILRRINHQHTILVDPFCGSGTLGFEFLLQKLKIPPGSFRKFAFEEFPYFQKVVYQNLKNFSPAPLSDLKIFLNDQEEKQMEGVKKTIQFLKMESFVFTSCMDAKLFLQKLDLKEDCLLLSNLPYGKRIAGEADFFKLIFDCMRSRKIKGPYGFLSTYEQAKPYQNRFQEQVSMKNGGLPIMFSYHR